MDKERLRQTIVDLSVQLSTTTNEDDKMLIKLFLDYYVDLALKNYR